MVSVSAVPRPSSQAARVVGLALVLVAAGGCGGVRFGLPEPISDRGEDVLGLWRGSFLAALAVGGLVWGLIVWAGLRYRRRNDDLPSQLPENIPVEVAYTVAPLVVVAVLFGFTLTTEQRVTAVVPDPDVVVEVTGFQWSWTFAYPDEGVTVTSDGVALPELVVPVGATVRFDLTSVDVNHSFWVPEMLVKRDLIPGVENVIDAEITRTGTWTGRCAEFCGLDHHAMLFTFRAVEPDDYRRWLDEAGPTGEVAR